MRQDFLLNLETNLWATSQVGAEFVFSSIRTVAQLLSSLDESNNFTFSSWCYKLISNRTVLWHPDTKIITRTSRFRNQSFQAAEFSLNLKVIFRRVHCLTDFQHFRFAIHIRRICLNRSLVVEGMIIGKYLR